MTPVYCVLHTHICWNKEINNKEVKKRKGNEDSSLNHFLFVIPLGIFNIW